VTVEERQRRLCLTILAVSLFMQLTAIGLLLWRSPAQLPESSYEHQQPQLSDWPTHGH
jgi:hypothetical protein